MFYIDTKTLLVYVIDFKQPHFNMAIFRKLWPLIFLYGFHFKIMTLQSRLKPNGLQIQPSCLVSEINVHVSEFATQYFVTEFH